MMGTEARPGPRRFEERNVPPALQGLVSRVLRAGVVLSGALLLIGVGWDAALGRADVLSSGAPASGAGLLGVLQAGGPAAVTLAGLLVLVVTPLTRVAISVGLFAAARDRPFTLITLFVLAVLGATIAVGAFR